MQDIPKEEVVTWEVPPVSKYEELTKDVGGSPAWEKNHKWKLLPKPGGAIMKPDDFYKLYGAQMQARASSVFPTVSGVQ